MEQISTKFYREPELIFGFSATILTLVLWFMHADYPVVSHYGIVFIFSLALLVSSKNFYQSIKQSLLNIDLLMLIAAIGAAALDDWHEASLLLSLFILGEGLEDHVVARAHAAMKAISQNHLSFVQVFRSGNWQTIDANLLMVGEQIRVKPGQVIPVDGDLVNGTSEIDLAILTGESEPVYAESGTKVYGGSTNINGSIEIMVTKTVQDSAMTRVQRLVKAAGQNKPQAETLIKRFAKYWVPSVLILSVATIAGMIWFDHDLKASIYRALTLLVAASPCALIIGTPACYAASSSNAASHGILIKGGRFFELLANISWVAFDKTGTLTEGRPRVCKSETFSRSSCLIDGHDWWTCCAQCTSIIQSIGEILS